MSTFSLAKLPTLAPSRPARYSRPFGDGIILSDPEQMGREACRVDRKAEPPAYLTGRDTDLWRRGFEAESLALSLPPISGGSDAAVLDAPETEVHFGDHYCIPCDAYHPPHAPDSFATPASRQRAADMVSAIVGAGDARRAAIAAKPAGYWDTIDPRTLGADARLVWDVAFGAGEYVAARGKHRLPPAHFDAMERAAFARGFRAEEGRMGDDGADEPDDSHSPEEFAEAGVRSTYVEVRD